MDSRWPMVPLGELLTQSKEREPVTPDRKYENFGIYSFGRGVFGKTPIDGATSSASSLYRARAGQFVYSRLFAFEGAYGLVPDEFDGYFVSNEFPLFDCKEAVIAKYIARYFQMKSTWQRVAALTTGMGNRRRRIKPEALKDVEIPLPPPVEQRRIVTVIDRLAYKIEEAKKICCNVRSEIDQLCRSILRDDRLGVITTKPMNELLTLRRPDTDVVSTDYYDFAGVYCFGRGLFRGQRKSGSEFAYKKLTRLREGEFVYPKLMAWEGAMGVVPKDLDGLFVSPEFPVFTVNTDMVVPQVLDVYFRSPSVWPQLSGASIGTNVRRRRLNPKDFLKYRFPLPSRHAQQRMVQVKKRVEQINRNSRVQGELDALLPSILDRAFKGEL